MALTHAGSAYFEEALALGNKETFEEALALGNKETFSRLWPDSEQNESMKAFFSCNYGRLQRIYVETAPCRIHPVLSRNANDRAESISRR